VVCSARDRARSHSNDTSSTTELSAGERDMLRWINEQTGTTDVGVPGVIASHAAGARVRNLDTDLRSGVVLLALLNAVGGIAVGFTYAKPTLLWHAMHNASLVLRCVQVRACACVWGSGWLLIDCGRR
jgi:hypothetical protein